MDKKQYVCPKCENTSYIADEFQATGGNMAKIFDVQNKKFTTISCENVDIQIYTKRIHLLDGIY